MGPGGCCRGEIDVTFSWEQGRAREVEEREREREGKGKVEELERRPEAESHAALF